jgi:hypothetical protein
MADAKTKGGGEQNLTVGMTIQNYSLSILHFNCLTINTKRAF